MIEELRDAAEAHGWSPRQADCMRVALERSRLQFVAPILAQIQEDGERLGWPPLLIEVLQSHVIAAASA